MALNQDEKTSESVKTDQSEAVKPEAAKPEVAIQKIAEGSIVGQVSTIEGPMINAIVMFGVIETFTDGKGNFLLEHVPPGIGKIIVKPTSNRFSDFTLDVLVEADKRKNLFLFLTEVTGTIEGAVTDESGKPLVGAAVSGIFRLGKPEVTVKTDEKGHYIFSEIPRGVYFFRARADGHMIEGATVNVKGASTIVADIILKPAALSITGKVLRKKDGAPVDCQIYLMRKGMVVTTATTTSSGDGKFIFDNLIPDLYEVTTMSPGYGPRVWRENIQKSESVNFELEEVVPAQTYDSGHR
ncbi:MAG: carboxypeptidase-like regulatory domain-containing protein [Nitrososphaerales archaeon]